MAETPNPYDAMAEVNGTIIGIIVRLVRVLEERGALEPGDFLSDLEHANSEIGADARGPLAQAALDSLVRCLRTGEPPVLRVIPGGRDDAPTD